ncbi:MAG: HD-GYP domain-containing protein [Muribaculum sp.]|nr:HD-GYP domain-containing protein [Muribaculum sp.]
MMKRLSTLQLLPGMIVAENVLSFDRKLVMSKGTVLTDNLITKLDLYGLLTVFVEDESAGLGESDYTEGQAPSYYARIQHSPVFKRFKADYDLNVDFFRSALNNVVERNIELDVKTILKSTLDMIAAGKGQICILDMLQNMREYDDSTFTHCMNVGLICNVMARWLKLDDAQVEMATACGLFHDIGKLMIPHAIITKPGKLDAAEYAQIQKHPIIGYQMLQAQNVDDHIRNAALMHHERSDGGGYPMRLSGGQIDPYARIVAIADVYDAMTAARVYRGPLCPFRVIEIFEQEGFQKYDTAYILNFLENVVNTYIRTRCRLSDGREAEIVFVNKEKFSRPVVRCKDAYLNLAEYPELTIEELL